jgi:hypothetical protein
MEQPILIENSCSIDKKLYVEHTNEILTSPGTRFGLRLGGGWFMLFSGGILWYSLSWGGPARVTDAMGIFDGLLVLIVFSLVFLAGLGAIILSFFPGWHLSYRTKHRKWFFTNADNVKLEQVSFQSVFTKDGITVTKNSLPECFGWNEIAEIKETEHLDLLILAGDTNDGFPIGKTRIRPAIILEKNSYTKGDWQTLKGYLKQYGSKGLKKLISEPEAEKAKESCADEIHAVTDNMYCC